MFQHWKALVLGATTVACGGPEREALSTFFSATRAGDRASVAGLSTVAFPDEGPSSWKVEQVLLDRHEEFALPEHLGNEAAATQARDKQFEEFTAFRMENVEELKAVLDAVAKNPQTRFKGKRAELYEGYEKFRLKRRELEGALAEAREKRDAETRLASKSVLREVDLKQQDGDVWIRDVLVRVAIRDGGEKAYRFSMRKYVLSSRQGVAAPARWIITDIKPQS